MKFRNISSGDQIDLYLRIEWWTGVVESQSFSNIVGPDPDDRIRCGLIIYSSTKEFHAKEPFRQVLIVACKRMLDDKFKKIPASIATGKTVAGQDRREFG